MQRISTFHTSHIFALQSRQKTLKRWKGHTATHFLLCHSIIQTIWPNTAHRTQVSLCHSKFIMPYLLKLISIGYIFVLKIKYRHASFSCHTKQTFFKCDMSLFLYTCIFHHTVLIHKCFKLLAYTLTQTLIKYNKHMVWYTNNTCKQVYEISFWLIQENYHHIVNIWPTH
jgi:hypothetical protein